MITPQHALSLQMQCDVYMVSIYLYYLISSYVYGFIGSSFGHPLGGVVSKWVYKANFFAC